MQLTIHTIEDAPSDSQPLLKGIAEEVGLVPNLTAMMAESPTLLGAFDGLRRTIAAGKLNPVHREVAGLAVAVAVDNAYGAAFHSTAAASVGVAEADIEAIRSGRPPADPACSAVYRLARDVVLTRGKVDDAVIAEAVAAAGLSNEAILEIVAECTAVSLVGLVDNLVNRVPLDDFLAPRAWQ